MSEWPGGVSDGLVLPCVYCHQVVQIDYTVTDSFWQRVVPKEHRLGVVCISCLDRLAKLENAVVGESLMRIQVVCDGYTVVAGLDEPMAVYWHERKPAAREGGGG